MELHQVPDIFKTGLNVLEHYGPTAFRMIRSVIGDRLRHSNTLADSARLEEEVARIGDAIESLLAEIEILQHRQCWNMSLAEKQGADPEFEAFATAAIGDAARSRSEAKRRSFGRYLARRLQIDSDEEILCLGRSMNIADGLSERQLTAVAAIGLVQNLGVPSVSFQDRAGAETWLKSEYSSALIHFGENPWSHYDLDMLGSFGVLGGGMMGGSVFWTSASEHAVDSWLAKNGVPAYDQLTDDAGSPAWRTRNQTSFPTIYKLSRLASGYFFNDEIETLTEVDTNRLDMMHLTPIGWTIAEIMLEQIFSDANRD